MGIDGSALVRSALGGKSGREVVQEALRPRASLDQWLTSGITPPQAQHGDPREMSKQLGRMRSDPIADGVSNFIKSALSRGTVELFGVRPSRDIARWRIEHPAQALVGNLATDVATFGLPFAKGGLLGLKAISKFAPTGRLLGSAEKMIATGTAPTIFAGGAIREGLRFAPMETTRLLGAAVAEPLTPESDTISTTLKHVALENLFILPIGGALGWLGSRSAARVAKENQSLYGKLQRHAREYPDIDPDAAPQLLYQQLRRKQRALPEDAPPFAKQSIAETLGMLKVAWRGETLPATGEIVKPLVGDKPASLIEALFLGGRKLSIRSRGTLDDPIVAASDLPAEAAGFSQYPRDISRTHMRGQIRKALAEMVPIGKHTWMLEEANNGLFTIVKRVPSVAGGKRIRSKTGQHVPDRWYITKTNDPKLFAPGADATLKRGLETFVTSRFAQSSAIPKPEAIPYYMAVRERYQMLDPIISKMTLAPEGTETAATTLRSLLPERAVDMGRRAMNAIDPDLSTIRAAKAGTEALSESMSSSFRKIFSPQRVRFAKYPRVQTLWQSVHQEMHISRGRINEIWFGRTDPTDTRSGFAQIFRPKRVPIEGMDEPLIDTLNKALGPGGKGDPELVRQANKVIHEMLSPEDMAKLGYGPEQIRAFEELQKWDTILNNEYLATRAQAGMGDETINLLPFHYMVSRTWKGNHRLPVPDKNGEIIGFGSGHSPAEAVREANAIIDLMEAEGAKGLKKFHDWRTTPSATTDLLDPHQWHRTIKDPGPGDAKNWLSMSEADLLQNAKDIATHNPFSRRFMLARGKLVDQAFTGKLPKNLQFARTGKRGFQGDIEGLTKDDIVQAVYGRMLELSRNTAKLAWYDVYKPQLAKVRGEITPEAFTEFDLALQKLVGMEGPFANFIDKAIDSRFADVLGPRSASKVARAMNSFGYTVTLGAGDLGFPMINSLQMLQTGVPETALLLTAPRADLIGRYSHWLMRNVDNSVRTMSIMEPYRIMGRALKDLIRPSPEIRGILARAADDGYLNPREQEAFMQSNLRGMKDAFNHFGSRPAESAAFIANSLSRYSEIMTRSVGFSNGYRIGREVLGLEADEAYKLATEFVQHTMFGYSAGERALIQTGAIGSTLGLFKGFTFNVLANYAKYVDQAAARSNFGPMLWAFLAPATVTGVQGLPTYGMADNLSRFLSDKGATDQLYSMLSLGDVDEDSRLDTILADTLVYGPMSILGVTLQSRASMPGAEVTRDLSLLVSSIHFERARALGAWLGTTTQDIAKGVNPFDDPRFMRNLMMWSAPRTLQRFFQSGDAMYSLRSGNKLLDMDFGWVQRAAFTLGISPTEVLKRFEASSDLYRDTKKLRTAVKFWGEQVAAAQRDGDHTAAGRLIWEARTRNVPVDSVLRSSAIRRSNMSKDLFERQHERHLARAKLRAFGLGQ